MLLLTYAFGVHSSNCFISRRILLTLPIAQETHIYELTSGPIASRFLKLKARVSVFTADSKSFGVLES